jgi:hypothetical protein
LEFLASIPTLRSLTFFAETQFTDAGLTHLEKLPMLESLLINSAHITDNGLRNLHGAKSLKSLHIEYWRHPRPPQFTDAGLVHLEKLPQLESLYLANGKFTDEGMAYVSRLTNLRSVFLSYANISKEGLERLKKLPELKSLYLPGVIRTDADLEVLSRMPKLENVMATGPGITDRGLPHLLQGKPHIRRVFLTNSKITDEGLALFPATLLCCKTRLYPISPFRLSCGYETTIAAHLVAPPLTGCSDNGVAGYRTSSTEGSGTGGTRNQFHGSHGCRAETLGRYVDLGKVDSG